MVFAIHWHESAMDLHVFPIPTPLLPPSPSHPSGSSQCTSPEQPSHASNLQAPVFYCWFSSHQIALKISQHWLSYSVLMSISVGREQTAWPLVPAHSLSQWLPGGECKLWPRSGVVRLPCRWGDSQAEFWGIQRCLDIGTEEIAC